MTKSIPSNCYSHEQIDAYFDRMLPPLTICGESYRGEAVMQEEGGDVTRSGAHEELKAQEAAIARTKEKCGLTAIEAAFHDASEEIEREMLVDQPPNTLAGATALLRHATEFADWGYDWPERRNEDARSTEDWNCELHRSLAAVTARLA